MTDERKGEEDTRIRCKDCYSDMYLVLKPFDKYQEGDCFCPSCSNLIKPITMRDMEAIK